ncbi:MAG: hypothetical protein HBSAPP03_25990 [Phycisphaerae bacterium]|nr:MAG: hypothetical protein HBSAPP03_25990 [Phycisphaerae bacterium]
MKPAFSTVGVPDWTLPRIAQRAKAWGFLGVELRSFGFGSRPIACDPALTAPAKARALFSRAGVSIVSIATSIRFDRPVTPPVLGHLLDTRRDVREAHGAVDLAISLECPFIRVFGFEIEGNETRTSAVARIVDRLRQAADHCDKSGVRLMLENGGSFATAADLADLLDRVNSPLVGAAYSVGVGRAAGENPADAVNVLGDRLVCVKIQDFKRGVPCALGDGDLHARDSVASLARAGYDGWLVHEFDRLWFKDAPDAEATLARSVRTLFEWIGALGQHAPAHAATACPH